MIVFLRSVGGLRNVPQDLMKNFIMSLKEINGRSIFSAIKMSDVMAYLTLKFMYELVVLLFLGT